MRKLISLWVKQQFFGSIPSNPCPVASDWHPGQPLPLQVQWRSDTCVAWALHAPSALHIHWPVFLSAGQFIINSCWLVKSGPGHGSRTYIYIHCEDPLPWMDFRGHEPILFSRMTDTHLKTQMHTQPTPTTFFSPISLPVAFFSPSFSLLFSPSFSTFCLHVRKFCIKSSPSGLGGGNMKMKCGHGWPFLLCVFVIPV